MRMSVVFLILMPVRMFTIRLTLPELFPRQVLLPVDHHIDLDRRNTVPFDPRHLQRCANVQRCNSLLQQLERNFGVHQRAEEHIAADARKSVEVRNSHRSRSLQVWKARYKRGISRIRCRRKYL
jgi:hypothetical protein